MGSPDHTLRRARLDVSLPTLPGDDISLPQTAQRVRDVMLPSQTDDRQIRTPLHERTMSSVDLRDFGVTLASFRAKLLDQHQTEFRNGTASPQLLRLLAWCTTALQLTQRLIAQHIEEDRRREEEERKSVVEDQPGSVKSSIVFSRIQEEIRAARQERERQGAEDDRRRALLGAAPSGRDEHSAELARKAATLSFQTRDLALIGELKLLLQTNRIPADQINDVLRLLTNSEEGHRPSDE